MNRVIISGRLTRDPMVNGEDNIRRTAHYTLAVDRRSKDGGADFISCTAFGERAVFTEKYLKKGTAVIVEGRIQTGSYTDRNGQKVYTTEVIVDNCEFQHGGKADEKPFEGADVTPFELPYEWRAGKPRNAFHNFRQRDYDADALLDMILRAG